MNLNYKEILRICVNAWDSSSSLEKSLLQFLVSNHLSHLSHLGVQPAGHPNLEVFLSQIEHELFRIPDKSFTYSNITKEE